MTPFFTRMSLILSIASGVLILLAVVGGEQVKEGWQINFTSRNVKGLWYFVQLDTDRGVMYSVQLAPEIGNPPSLSPNGRYVAFDYVGLLMLFNGRENIELTTRSSVMPTWSPDSRYFSYVDADRSTNQVTLIGEIDEDGTLSDPIPLSVDEFSVMQAYPLWSPDSERMTYLTQNNSTSSNLLVADAYSRNPHRLTSTVAPYQPVAWSPDSEKIAFVWYEPNNNRFPLYLSQIRVDGTEQEIIGQIIPNRIERLRWSPDGRFIAYIASGFVGLYVIEVATGDITGPIDYQLEASLIEWSPESDQLVFSARNDRQLYVVGRDGRNIRRLTNNDNFNMLMP